MANKKGITVIENNLTRNHTEIMLDSFEADIKTSKQGKNKSTFIKLVRTVKTNRDTVLFKKEMVEVPDGKAPESHIKEKYSK